MGSEEKMAQKPYKVRTVGDVIALVPNLSLEIEEKKELIAFIRTLPSDTLEAAYTQLLLVIKGQRELDEALEAIELLQEEEEIVTEATTDMSVAEVRNLLEKAGAKLGYYGKKKLGDLALGGTLPGWVIAIINNHIRHEDTPDGGEAGELIGSTWGLFATLWLRERVIIDELRESNPLGLLAWILRSVWNLVGIFPWLRIFLIALVVLTFVVPEIGGAILGAIISGFLSLVWAVVGRYVIIGSIATSVALFIFSLVRPVIAIRQAISRLANCPGWSKERIEQDPERAAAVLVNMVWVGEGSIRATLGLQRGGHSVATRTKSMWQQATGFDQEHQKRVESFGPLLRHVRLSFFRDKLEEIARAQERDSEQTVIFGYQIIETSVERTIQAFEAEGWELSEGREERLGELLPTIANDLSVLVDMLNRSATAMEDIPVVEVATRWQESILPIPTDRF